MLIERRRNIEGFVFLAAFALCIPAANWLISNFGTLCPPEGPCLIPVAPGILAPSSVLAIGVAFVLRDLVQRRLGINGALGAILAGTLLSVLVAPPSLVLASVMAFFISEMADFGIYTAMQKGNFVLAVAASSLVALVLDSVVFLALAFASLDFLIGLVLGKTWIVLLSLPLVAWLRRRDARLGFTPHEG
ncbi:VUT family protein [Roseococcus sp.]|uniref:VUT family protein n=1 Tax=Roseococcus sp. TaxID=2109646 RepID=UPI003BACFF33